MSAEKAEAIILRTVDFSESSLILTLFSREFGKIQALAKGGRRPRAPFDSALDLLAICRIVFLRKSSDALDLLTEAKLVQSFRVFGRELGNLYAGFYVAELLADLTDDYDPHPELYDLAKDCLSALSGGEAAGRNVVHFELAALRLLGHLPEWDACCECGSSLPETEWVAFWQLNGGALCPKCRPGRKQVASIRASALRAMGVLAQTARHDWRDLPLDGRTYGQIRGVLNHFLSHHLGKRPRLQQYLAQLSP